MQKATTTTVHFPSTEAKHVLTEILREGAQTLLVEAIEVEAAEWIDAHAPLKAVAEDILAADASPLNWRRLRRWDGPTRGNSQPREGRHG